MDVYKTQDGKSEVTEWRDHKGLVLHELQRMNDNIERLTDAYHTINMELAGVKIKASMLGLGAGFFVSVLAIAIDWFSKD